MKTNRIIRHYADKNLSVIEIGNVIKIWDHNCSDDLNPKIREFGFNELPISSQKMWRDS